MAISISYVESKDYRDLYDVTFFGSTIHVAVTSTPWYVGQWINVINSIYGHNSNSGLFVGLDVEWRPSFNRNSPQNPVAVLQLCVGNHCLVFQLRHASEIPASLTDFLTNCGHTFVGVGIHEDVQRLWNDYWMVVSNCVDLRYLAANRCGNPAVRNTGLTALARQVLNVEYNKPRNITLSNWDNARLSEAQVQYASIDAFLSSEIGRWFSAADG